MIAGAVAMLLLAGRTSAQICTLPMDVPAHVDVNLETNVRGLGLRLTWPAPSDAISTCYALLDTAALGIDVAVTGDYQDDFDRMISFTFADTGIVGSDERNRLVVNWVNLNRRLTGEIGGEVNLSNTGGLWRYSFASETWSQENAGLPQSLPYTNLDAFAIGGGTRLTALSSGNQPGIVARGLYRSVENGPWQPVGVAALGTPVVNRLAIFPADGNRFAAGTTDAGVHVTFDGGQTFAQWRVGTGVVGALAWTSTRLYAGITGNGLYHSEDGINWAQYATLRVRASLHPDSLRTVAPQVKRVVEDPNDANHIFVLLANHLLYHSTDGGTTWSSLGGDLVVYNTDTPESWKFTGSSLWFDGPDLVIGTERQGIYRSTNGGVNWVRAVSPVDGETLSPNYVSIVEAGGALIAQANQAGLVRSDDRGATWTLFAQQRTNRNALDLLRDVDGSLLLPTWGGGIYIPWTPINLSETIQPGATAVPYRNLQFGLAIAFGPGRVVGRNTEVEPEYPGESFRLNTQDYQGWIVWRGERDAPDQMTMVGRYDKNNPESCIQGFCGDDSYIRLPNCFSERRAACFDFSTPGQISFFDGDVYNGFSYFYAVTPYDYGDVSLVTDAISLAAPLVHPDRYPGDIAGLGDGPGNRFAYEIDELAQPAADGKEIYVYPNPLRRDAGIVGGEGEEVRWANLPPDSRIEVYTLAGDKLADLHGDAQREGNMYWTTRNDDGAPLASGIYIWRCIMPARNDFWGKLIIIR